MTPKDCFHVISGGKESGGFCEGIELNGEVNGAALLVLKDFYVPLYSLTVPSLCEGYWQSVGQHVMLRKQSSQTLSRRRTYLTLLPVTLLKKHLKTLYCPKNNQ